MIRCTNHNLRRSVAITLLFCILGVARDAAQDVPGVITSRGISQLPSGPFSYRPKLSLQDALRIAEKHALAKNDSHKYFLASAKLALADSAGKKTFFWAFEWRHESGALGDNFTILVTLDGVAQTRPGM